MRSISLLLMGCLLSVYVTGQEYIPIDYEQKKEYIEFEIDYYLVAQEDLNKLNDKDKTRLKKIQTEKFVRQYLNADQELTSIIQINEQKNAFADWMESPEVILIDKNGISNYDKRGEKIRHVEHTPTYKEKLSDFQNDLSSEIIFPNREQLQFYRSKGFSVEYQQNGFIEIKRGQRSLIYKKSDGFIQENFFYEDGSPLREMKKHYMELPSGEKMLERSKETVYLELSSGVKAKHVKLKLYSDQSFENVYRRTEIKESEKLEVVTSTDQNKLRVLKHAFESKNTTALIFNMNGRLVLQERVNSNEISQLDISDLPSGVYILKVTAEGQSQTSKFVKL